MFHLTALRGLRRGEACGLHWRDLDLDAGTAVICAQLRQNDGHVTAGPLTTRNSERVIALDRTTIRRFAATATGSTLSVTRPAAPYHDSALGQLSSHGQQIE